jgi:hypothetical protein
MNSEVLFYRWFVAPVNILRQLPHGDGAIGAFMITLPLVERAATARLQLRDEETKKDNIKKEVSIILGFSEEESRERSIFWNMFRDGLLHLGMPFADGPTKWLFHGGFGALPEFVEENGIRYFRLDPFKFADYILSLYWQDPRMITQSTSSPFGDIFEVRMD